MRPVPTDPTAGLPRRPRRRPDVPLLWRADDELQVGVAPAPVAVLSPVTRAEARWLVGLDGLRRLDQAVADASAEYGLPTARAFSLLRSLTGACALDDAAERPGYAALLTPDDRLRLGVDRSALVQAYGDVTAGDRVLAARSRARVQVLGTGRVGSALAPLLAAAGVGTVDIVDEPVGRPAGPADLTPAGLRPAAVRRDAAAQVRDLVRAVAPAITAAVAGPDLVVLAPACHPDAIDATSALAQDLPHLPVAAYGGRAVVGPLVLPGRTGCLRCADLRRADADPAWPRMAVQLAHLRPGVVPVDVGLATAAAALASLRALAWIDAAVEDPDSRPTARPAHGDGTAYAWEVRIPGPLVRRIAHPPHPLCGCRWT